MTVALFAPCYVDQFYPGVAVATLRLLEALGVDVRVPPGAVCCGQPMANAGFSGQSARAEAAYREAFAGFETVVTPSGSCAAHLRAHVGGAGGRTLELCEFLRDHVGLERVRALGARWDARVGVHIGCHALRGLGLATPTEAGPDAAGACPGLRSGGARGPGDTANCATGTLRASAVHDLLGTVRGLEIVDLARPDECCGFGGTFAVAEPAVSVAMGRARLADHTGAGAEAVVSTDVSCAMHMEGLARREAPEASGGTAAPLRFVHVAEALMMGVEAPAEA